APKDARKAWATIGATLIELPETSGQLDLTAALQTLAAKGLTRILSEGGSTLAAALIKARLVDDLALFSGGLLLGAEGHPALGPLALTALGDAPRPRLQETHTLGPDTYSLWSL
uniref:RibD family protein n=1 Tax=Tabrizicola sp. TaxID=2005166 RepID=UPI0035B1E98A